MRNHLRWVLQRYRDVHDLWHVLSGLPTTLAWKKTEVSYVIIPPR